MLRHGRMFVLIVLTLSYMIGELTHFIVMITGSQLANDIGKLTHFIVMITGSQLANDIGKKVIKVFFTISFKF